jgi:hypothetical protein
MTAEPKFFYANALELSVSPYDCSLRFVRNEVDQGQTPMTGSAIKFHEADTLTVCMSAAHLKAMLPSLLSAVVDYEKNFGKLGLLPELQTAFDKVFVNEEKK